MDTLLRELAGMEYTHPIAYADDLAILISGKSRAELERRWATAIEVVERWASVNKLVISKEKTTGLMLQGFLNARDRLISCVVDPASDSRRVISI